MINETYAVMAAWDFGRSKRENLDRLRETNFIGATSLAWLRDVCWVLNRRFEPDGADRPLVTLAQNEFPIEEWKPLLLWHMTRSEFLVRDFLENWLFNEFEAGIFDVSTDRGIRSGNQTLTEIMYGLFLQSLGYAKDLDLSELEIGLEEKGLLGRFEDEYRRLFSKQWSSEKGKVAFALSEASRVLHSLDPDTYTLQETGEERFVGVPEQGGRDLISSDPLSPGTVYSAGVTSDGTVGLYRVEVSISTGTGKLKLAGGVAGAMKESVQRAFSFLQSKKSELGIARDLDVSDLHVEVIDLLANRVEAELGVAFFVAAYSAMRKAPVGAGLLILGDMSVQGNIKPLRSLTEPLQVAKDNGASRSLIPIENKRNFLDVSADIMEHVDPVFYGDPKTAALKALGGVSH